MFLRKLAKITMLLRKLAMLSYESKVIQKDNRRSEILKGLMIVTLLAIYNTIYYIYIYDF
jgi:hypothetical protein